MFDLFKKERKKKVPKPDDTPETVYNLDEEGLDAYANALASEMIDTMQESFKQSQENSQKAYEAAVKLHRQYVANIDAKPYTGPVAPVPLSPYEVLFLWYIDGHTAKEPDIAIYWTYEYGLGDFSTVIDKLIRAGYLQVSDYRFNMQKCTLPEIKEILKTHGLAVSGKKADLTKRLEDNVHADVLKKTFNRGYLQLTEAGRRLLGDNNHIVYYQQHKQEFTPTLTISEVERLHKERPTVQPEELLREYVRLIEGEWTQTYEEKEQVRKSALENYNAIRGTLCAVCHAKVPLNAYDICQACEERGTYEDGILQISMLFGLLHRIELQELEKAVYRAIRTNTGVDEAATAYVTFCISYGLAGRMYLEDMVGVYLNSKHKDSSAGNRATFYEAIITAKNI